MKMYTMSFNKMREVEEFINSNGISKENIINVFQLADKTFTVVYYAD